MLPAAAPQAFSPMEPPIGWPSIPPSQSAVHRRMETGSSRLTLLAAATSTLLRRLLPLEAEVFIDLNDLLGIICGHLIDGFPAQHIGHHIGVVGATADSIRCCRIRAGPGQ